MAEKKEKVKETKEEKTEAKEPVKTKEKTGKEAEDAGKSKISGTNSVGKVETKVEEKTEEKAKEEIKEAETKAEENKEEATTEEKTTEEKTEEKAEDAKAEGKTKEKNWERIEQETHVYKRVKSIVFSVLSSKVIKDMASAKITSVTVRVITKTGKRLRERSRSSPLIKNLIIPPPCLARHLWVSCGQCDGKEYSSQ